MHFTNTFVLLELCTFLKGVCHFCILNDSGIASLLSWESDGLLVNQPRFHRNLSAFVFKNEKGILTVCATELFIHVIVSSMMQCSFTVQDNSSSVILCITGRKSECCSAASPDNFCSLLEATGFRAMLTVATKRQAIKAVAYYFVLGRSMPSVEQFVQGM